MALDCLRGRGRPTRPLAEPLRGVATGVRVHDRAHSMRSKRVPCRRCCQSPLR